MVGCYLLFERNCAEAIKAYEKAFGVKVLEMRTYGEIPMSPGHSIPLEDKALVMHARLQLDEMELMCVDARERASNGGNMYVSVTTQDAAMVQRAWTILREGGTVFMDIAPTFFAAQHGSLRDRFGINWMFTVLT